MVTDERVSLLETTPARFMDQTSIILAEIRTSNARTDRQLLEMQQQADFDRQQSERERKDFNKRMRKFLTAWGR